MESFKVTAQKDVTDKMYRTSKITYEWKADLTSLRPQTQNVLINQEVLNSILKPNPGKNNSTIVKGRIVSSVHLKCLETAELLRFSLLDASVTLWNALIWLQ